MKLALCLLLAAPLHAQADSAVVAFEHGRFVFTDLKPYFHSPILKRSYEGIVGTVHNETNSPWEVARFVFTARAKRPNGDPVEIRRTETIGVIPHGKAINFYEGFHRMVPMAEDVSVEEWTVHFEGGRRVPTPEAAAAEERKRIEDEERAARSAAIQSTRKAQVAEGARKARLAKLASIRQGPVIIASDRKCHQQFEAALSMDGLDKRKRIAELIAYSCGWIVTGPAHVYSQGQVADLTKVSIAEGAHLGRQGLVRTSDLIQPASKTAH